MSSQPNILVFMTDQEQGDVIGPDHPCHTPNAARLAAEGVRFREARSPAAHCCPARATFLTGLYPSRHGVYNNVLGPGAINSALAAGTGMFSEGLRAAGYNLAFSGKWHVSDAEGPSDRGWDELLVTSGKGDKRNIVLGRDPPPGAPRARGEIVRPGWGRFRLYETVPDSSPGGYEGHPDAAVVRTAIEELPRLAAAGAPWFLFVGPDGPHDPFRVPERFVRMYDAAQIPLPESYGDSLEDKPRVYQRLRRQIWDQLSEDEVRESIAHYYGFCTFEDALLGEVLDALQATGQAEQTLVVRLSDHGEYAGAHGLYLKGVAAFREAYSVVCAVRWPEGVAEPGREIDEFVTLADFAPTFLELAHAPVPPDLTGRSLLPFLRGETPADWPDAFHAQFNGVELYYTQRVVETTAHKYVFNGFDFDELYDLRADPHELANLSERPEFQHVKRALVRRMWAFARRQRDMILDPYPTVALAPWGPADGGA